MHKGLNLIEVRSFLFYPKKGYFINIQNSEDYFQFNYNNGKT